MHEEICVDNQNIKVRKGAISSFDVLTGPKVKKKKKKSLCMFPLRPYFILRKLAGSQYNHSVSQWADSCKNKEIKCLPVLTYE